MTNGHMTMPGLANLEVGMNAPAKESDENG